MTKFLGHKPTKTDIDRLRERIEKAVKIFGAKNKVSFYFIFWNEYKWKALINTWNDSFIPGEAGYMILQGSIIMDEDKAKSAYEQICLNGEQENEV